MSGPLFVDSIGQITSPGVAAVDVQAPLVIEGVPNGKMLIAGQFGWGPPNVVYEPTDGADFLSTFEPAGSPRSSSGYRALMRRKRLALAVVRVLHSDATKAKTSTAGTGGAWVAEAKYAGVLGNGIVVTEAPASNGVSGSKKFTATLTDSVTGSYSELIADNVAPPNGGAAISVDCTNLKLIGLFTVASAMSAFDGDGNVTLGGTTSGSNGTAVTSADYTAALDLLDEVSDGAVMTTDDCGSSLRSTVNTSLQTHANSAGGRYLALIQGPSDNAWSAVKTDKANYTSKWALHFASWVYVKDDAGTQRLVPTSTFAGSAIINLDPEQSHARAASFVTAYYDGVDALYTAYFNPASSGVQADAMNYGIQIMQREPTGDYSFAHDRNCNTTVADRYTITSRLRRFFALSLTSALRAYRNAPNIAIEQRDLVKSMTQFMAEQVRKGRATSFSIDPNSNNTTNTIASGYFLVGNAVNTPAPMERIGLLIKASPTVVVEAQ